MYHKVLSINQNGKDFIPFKLKSRDSRSPGIEFQIRIPAQMPVYLYCVPADITVKAVVGWWRRLSGADLLPQPGVDHQVGGLQRRGAVRGPALLPASNKGQATCPARLKQF
jgi:hypothetical protein